MGLPKGRGLPSARVMPCILPNAGDDCMAKIAHVLDLRPWLGLLPLDPRLPQEARPSCGLAADERCGLVGRHRDLAPAAALETQTRVGQSPHLQGRGPPAPPGQPPLWKRRRVSGNPITFRVAARRRSTTAVGVLAGAKSPIQLSSTRASTPDSRPVGTCGNKGSRSAPEVTIGFTRTSAMNGRAVVVLSKKRSTRPARRST